jgi:predicted DNA-binding transcriptional regulator AlpA
LDNKIINEEEAAEILSIGTETLRNLRRSRKGPVFLKIGKSVRYIMSDIEDYVERARVKPETRNRNGV